MPPSRRTLPTAALAGLAVLAVLTAVAFVTLRERPAPEPRPVAQYPPAASTAPIDDGTYGPGSRREARFLEMIRFVGMPFSSDRQAIDAAHTVCGDLGGGMSFMEADVATMFRIPWMTAYTAGLFIMQATDTYCPELSP